MRFGKCANCREYRYLKNKGKCPSCLQYKINVYEIQGKDLKDALEKIEQEVDNKNLPGSTKSSYDNLIEEILDSSDVANYGVKIGEDAFDSVKDALRDYRRNSSGSTPVVDSALKNLSKTDPKYKLGTGKPKSKS